MTNPQDMLEKSPVLKRLVEMGVLHPATQEPAPLKERQPIYATLEEMLAELDEIRADRD
jgi:hypothetical protein